MLEHMLAQVEKQCGFARIGCSLGPAIGGWQKRNRTPSSAKSKTSAVSRP